jgi:uncharacterized repeat protein (TIGR03803 family)
MALALVLLSANHSQAEGWEHTDLRSFGQRNPNGGHRPEAAPILGKDGALYGTTRPGGAFGVGVVYRFQPSDGSSLVIRDFVGGADGGSPIPSAFVQADDGRLYGLALNPRLLSRLAVVRHGRAALRRSGYAAREDRADLPHEPGWKWLRDLAQPDQRHGDIPWLSGID